MLVLSRKPDEIVQIGDDIQVRVVEVRGNRVKLGIVAPDGVRIMRCELLPSAAASPGLPAAEPAQDSCTPLSARH